MRATLPDVVRAAAPALLGIGGFALYATSLCPTVYLGDSGELCAAVASGGVAHPPGYPLFTTLGAAALRVLPWGEPAWRIGILVALCAAVTLVLLYHLSRALGAGIFAAALCTAVFGLSRTFWSQSARVEVYSLHTALLATALLSCVLFRQRGRPGALAVGALAVGLGAAHHLTLLLSLPGLLWIVASRAASLRDRALLPLAAAAPGPFLYLLLVRRAAGDPAMNWGRVTTLSALWRHVSGRAYQSYLGPPTGASFATAGRLLAENFPFPLWLAALAGWVRVARGDRGLAVGFVLAAVGPLFFALCYGIEDIAPQYLGPILMLSALAAVGVEAALQALPTKASRPLGVLAGALVPALFFGNRTVGDLSALTGARDLARAKLDSCAPGSTLLATGDNDLFPMLYVQEALRERRDILVIARDALRYSWRNLPDDPSLWYVHALRRRGVPAPTDQPSPAEIGRRAEDGCLVDLLEGPLRGRTLYTTFVSLPAAASDDPVRILAWFARRQATPSGVVVRLDDAGGGPSVGAVVAANRDFWERTPLPELGALRAADEVTPDYLARHYAVMLAWHARLLATVLPGEAESVRGRLRRWAPDLAEQIAAEERTLR